ncbi:MAG: nucleotidyltransferase domain-containing protein [Methanophagales archaeon]|nr:nucleotidyltransferase domain-containing protein [Methanophagales archaeon]
MKALEEEGKEELIEISKRALEKIGERLGIDYAIIFGSAVRGAVTAESDVDFGVKFKEIGKSTDLLKKIAGIKDAVEEKLKRDVDIVIMNGASLGLCYEIFSEGEVVFISNEERFFEEKIKVVTLYLDFKYYLERHWEEKMEKVLYGE